MEITKTNSIALTQFITLLLIVFLAPFIGNQFITGTIVNAVLILSFFLLGYKSAILLCFLPSAISFSLGFMPLAIMLPFIMIGNVILVSAFKLIKNYWIALFSGGIVKASLLFLTASNLYASLINSFNFDSIPNSFCSSSDNSALSTSVNMSIKMCGLSLK
jgi:hypothetical protein